MNLIWEVFPSVLNCLQQEDKEPMFDSVKTIVGMLEVSAEFAKNITFNRERIQKALPAGHLDATTLADYLVKKASLLINQPCVFTSEKMVIFAFGLIHSYYIPLMFLSINYLIWWIRLWCVLNQPPSYFQLQYILLSSGN